MKDQKMCVKTMQMVCFEILNFKPTSEQPTETVKFIFHGPFITSKIDSPKFSTPFILATQEFVLGSEELINFLSDWNGKRLDIRDGVLSYEELKSSIIGNKRALNAKIKFYTFENITHILRISPHRGSKSLWLIKGLKVPSYLCNRVSFDFEDIGLHKLNTISSNSPKDECKFTSNAVPIENPTNIPFQSVLSENKISCNVTALEIYLEPFNIDVRSEENKKIIKDLARKYTEDEIEELRFALKNGFKFKNMFDIDEFLNLKRH